MASFGAVRKVTEGSEMSDAWLSNCCLVSSLGSVKLPECKADLGRSISLGEQQPLEVTSFSFDSRGEISIGGSSLAGLSGFGGNEIEAESVLDSKLAISCLSWMRSRLAHSTSYFGRSSDGMKRKKVRREWRKRWEGRENSTVFERKTG